MSGFSGAAKAAGWLISALLFAGVFGASAIEKAEVTYDHDCFAIGGEDVLLYSGSIHYFRCPKLLWHDRLLKIKRAGFNCIQTYIPWNHHEKREGVVDLSEAKEFFSLCESMGLYIIARPGPFVCAEWNGGGFPDWLVAKRVNLRSNDPEYMAYVKHWYDSVLPVIREHLITNGGRVVLVQIENEYGYPAESKREAIRAMYRMMRGHGIDVPLVTCNTEFVWDNEDPDMADIINGWNSGGVRWETIKQIEKRVRETREEEFNAPTIVLEHPGGGGTFSNYTGRNGKPMHPGNFALVNRTAIMEGAGVVNFYMLFGGTNLRYDGAGSQSTSYWNRDPVRCPLDEPGGIWEGYDHVKQTGQWLSEFGALQVRAQPVPDAAAIVSCNGKKPPRIVEKVNGEAAFIFIREAADETKQIRFSYLDPKTNEKVTVPTVGKLTLPARDMQMLNINVPLPGMLLKYSTSQILCIGKSADRTVVVLHGTEGSDGETELHCNVKPQVSGGLDARWDDTKKSLTLNYAHAITDAYALVDNVQLIVINTKRAYRTWKMKMGKDTLPLISNAWFLRDYSCSTAGVQLNVESLPGSAHFATVLPRVPARGMRNGENIDFSFDANSRMLSWTMDTPTLPFKEIRFKSARFAAETFRERGDWRSIDLKPLEDLGLNEHGYLVYKASFQALETDRMTLRFYVGSAKTPTNSRQLVGDPALVFINGRRVKEVPVWHGLKTRFNLAEYVRPGKNELVVAMEKLGRPSTDGNLPSPGFDIKAVEFLKGLASVTLLDGGKQPRLKAIDNWQLKHGLDGQNAGFQGLEYRDDGWKKVKLGTAKKPLKKGEESDGIGWYRLGFDLDLPDDWSIPLKLHMEAESDALIYVNGRIVGRYNLQGWQRDFYLPECWLNSSGRNVIAIAVRSSGEGSGLLRASILPYKEYSVQRHAIAVQYQ